MRPSTAARLRCHAQKLLRPIAKRPCSRLAQPPSLLTASLSAASTRPFQPCIPLHPSRGLRFMSSSERWAVPDTSPEPLGMAFYDLSPERQIHRALASDPDASWGWVIYRTTYRPDLDRHWESFKQLIQTNTIHEVIASDTPRIIHRLDWDFVEDPSLEGASLKTLKQKFRDWATTEGADPTEEEDSHTTRHTYFFQVDEESLLSMLSDPAAPTAPSTEAKLAKMHVSMVRGWVDGEEGEDENGELPDSEDWMKMKATMIAPYFYAEMTGSSENWYVHYMPPPHGISFW